MLTILLAPAGFAGSEKALQAEQMLTPERWAQAVRIENTNDSSRYPETVYGTVFEFNDVLWFYTKTGTQPLQASRNQLEEYKENLLPLLRTMDRGFTSFKKLTAKTSEDVAGFPSLKNGCVVESIFSMDELKEQQEPVLEAKLLLYSSKNPTRSREGRTTGHCVLVYQTPTGIFYVDPPKIDVTGTMTKTREWDPKKMAEEIESHYGDIVIEEAFFEPFEIPATRVAHSG